MTMVALLKLIGCLHLVAAKINKGAHHFDMWHVTLCSGLWHFHVAGGTLIHQH